MIKPLSQIALGFTMVLTAPAVQAQTVPSVQISPLAPSPDAAARAQPEKELHAYRPDPKRIAMFQRTEQFKRDGLSGDRTQIPQMIACLDEKEHTAEKFTVWLALSRLGAVEAVPVMDAALKRAFYSPDTYLGEFARAARARLLAETEPTPHTQAARFFQEIGETPEHLSGALEKQRQENTVHPVTGQVLWKETADLDMLADMIYHGPGADLLADPLLAPVEFRLSPDADYKVSLALLAPDQQRQKLIGWLMTDSDAFAPGQLLLDLGRPEAVAAITAKLQELDLDDAAYRQRGYGDLLLVLHKCDLQHRLPIWYHLRHLSQQPNFGDTERLDTEIREGY